jgi:hypothetical protein
MFKLIKYISIFCILSNASQIEKKYKNYNYLLEGREKFELPKKKQILPSINDYSIEKKTYKLWSQKDVPFWLRLANQAMYLQFDKIKDKHKLLLKIEIAKKLPYLKKKTYLCLMNPWFNDDVSCKFENIRSNIEFLCLIQNSNPVELQNNILSSTSTGYNDVSSLCWIIYAVNYLEYCQIKLIIDQIHCSFSNIELIIKTVLKRYKATIVLNKNVGLDRLRPIYEFYYDIFEEKAMEISTQILLLINDQHFKEFIPIKIGIQRILNYLLFKFAQKYEHNSNVKSRVMTNEDKFKISMQIIDNKIEKLTEISIRFLLKHVFKLIQKIDNKQ